MRSPSTSPPTRSPLPAALKRFTAQRIWVLWKWHTSKTGKRTKVPYQPNGNKAKSNNPKTWTTYEAAVSAASQFDGIGFVLPDGTGALDVDDCRDAATGTVHHWAQELIDRCGSYTEITPSGTGIRIIGDASGPWLSPKKMSVVDGVGVECYRKATKFITVTGNQIAGGDDLTDIDTIIDQVFAELNEDEDELERTLRDGGGDRYETRSDAMWFVINELLRRGQNPDQIEATLLGLTGNAIADHIADQPVDASKYVKRQVERAAEALGAEIFDINKDYAYVIVGGKAAVMRFDAESKFDLLKIEAFKGWHANKKKMKVGKRLVPAAEVWLKHPMRREYAGIEFSPPDSPVHSNYYNLWRGFAVEPKQGDCSKFLAHVHDNVAQGDGATYDWVMGWFADIFQNPSTKQGSSLVLRGDQGVGKTKVGEVIGSLIGGNHYVLVSSPRYVTGNFNAHMASLLLLHADEAFWAGDKSAEGKLKDLVTGHRHLVEFKFIDPISLRNFVRLFVTGNSNWTVPAGFGERRFCVLDVSEDHKQDYPYFNAIDVEMANGGREALLHYLLNFDLSKVNLRSILKTTALLEQKISSASPEEAWWLDVLSSGQLPPAVGKVSEKIPRSCFITELYADYISHAKAQGVSRRSIETKMGMFLSKAVGPSLDRKQFEDRWYYVLPSLIECRKRFAQMMQHQINWDGEDGTNWRNARSITTLW